MKQRVLLEAERIFQDRGFAAVSVQEIVDAAGITKGGLYYYFESKEEILFTIHKAVIDRALVRAQSIEAMPVNCREKLRLLMAELVNSFDRTPAAIRVYLHERRHLVPAHAALIRAKRRLYEQILVGVLGRGIEDGEFRPVFDPSVAALGIFGMCNWMYSWYKSNGQLSNEAILQQFLMLVEGGLIAGTNVPEREGKSE